jgi:DNA repair exonuclease SbcCD ATPase subunit
MIHDKLALALKDLTSLQNDIKDIKREMKEEERNSNEDYLALKSKVKEMAQQVKDMNNEFMANLRTEELYQNLLESKTQKDEEVGKKVEEILKMLDQLPKKHFKMDVDTENGVVKMEVQPEMKLYMNGKILKMAA